MYCYRFAHQSLKRFSVCKVEIFHLNINVLDRLYPTGCGSTLQCSRQGYAPVSAMPAHKLQLRLKQGPIRTRAVLLHVKPITLVPKLLWRSVLAAIGALIVATALLHRCYGRAAPHSTLQEEG
jgi:hypothetical protein